MTTRPGPDAATVGYAMKKELRKRMRGLRNTATPQACAERSDRIATAVLAELDALGAVHVGLFADIESRNEVHLGRVDRECRARGRHLYYPSIEEPEADETHVGERVMTMRMADDLASLEERGLGFREPAPGARIAPHLDAIVVPALAVDPRGYRLGYGAGFYDRMLPLFCPPGKSIIVAFDYQMLVELPVMDHDVACDVIVTDTRVIRKA